MFADALDCIVAGSRQSGTPERTQTHGKELGTMLENIEVVSREDIRALHTVMEGGKTYALGELRDLRWHDQLKDFLGVAPLSIGWVRLLAGEVLHEHRHPIQSLMVFYRGSGEMLGDVRRPLSAGDVVVVPPGREHGFVGGPEGLYGLSIQFGAGLYTVPEAPRVVFSDETALRELLAFNQDKLSEFLRRPIFRLLSDGTLNDPKKRKAYLEHLQIWVDGNQTLLFSRQATSVDPKYAAVFLQHLREEIGHEAMHADRAEAAPTDERPRDAVMEAITDWFAHQMYLLDNAEKAAIIHLVIENASSAYHRQARPVLSQHINDEYFDVHVEADAAHAALGEQLLRDATPEECHRLAKIIGEAWDMLGAMTDRLVEITRAA